MTNASDIEDQSRSSGARTAGSPSPSLALTRLVGRRELLLGGAAGISALAGLGLYRGRSDSPAGHAAPSAIQDATPSGTPSPVATPASVAPPATIGGLEVIRDQRPVYAEQPVESDELRIVLTAGRNENFSPVAFNQDFLITASYLDPLVWIDEVTMEPKPWLAERWEWNDDNTAITFTLRGDVTWHDGDPFRARDVVFSFTTYRDDVESGVRNFFVNMESAEEVDDRHVRVRLTSPDGNWLLNASSQFIFQRKQFREFWENQAEGRRTLSDFDWEDNDPVGTGPWIVGERSEESLQLSRNDDYWAGPPHFQRLTLTWDDDSGARLGNWMVKATDLLWPIRPSDVTAASAAPGRLYVADAASVMFAAFNFDNPSQTPPDFLNDGRIRRALSLAVDRTRYATEVFASFVQADKAGTIAQPWAHDETLLNPQRNVAEAKRLLDEAGFPDGFFLTCIVRNDTRPELRALLDGLVADFAEIDVSLEVQRLGPDQFIERWADARDYDLIAYSYNLFPGFTDFDLYGSAWDIRQNPQGWNPGGYANDTVDEAIREILITPDLAAQREALVRLQRAADEDLFGLWFGFPQDLILVQPDILGFQPNKQWQTWDTRKLWRRRAPGAPSTPAPG